MMNLFNIQKVLIQKIFLLYLKTRKFFILALNSSLFSIPLLLLFIFQLLNLNSKKKIQKNLKLKGLSAANSETEVLLIT